MKFRDILSISPQLVEVRTNGPKGYDCDDLLLGQCTWDGENFVSTDGDYYTPDDEIDKYEYESDGSVTVWITSDWI